MGHILCFKSLTQVRKCFITETSIVSHCIGWLKFQIGIALICWNWFYTVLNHGYAGTTDIFIRPRKLSLIARWHSFNFRWSDGSALSNTYWDEGQGYPKTDNLGWYCGYQKTKELNGESNAPSNSSGKMKVLQTTMSIASGISSHRPTYSFNNYYHILSGPLINLLRNIWQSDLCSAIK